jgi:hypothetical protein
MNLTTTDMFAIGACSAAAMFAAFYAMISTQRYQKATAREFDIALRNNSHAGDRAAAMAECINDMTNATLREKLYDYALEATPIDDEKERDRGIKILQSELLYRAASCIRL